MHLLWSWPALVMRSLFRGCNAKYVLYQEKYVVECLVIEWLSRLWLAPTPEVNDSMRTFAARASCRRAYSSSATTDTLI